METTDPACAAAHGARSVEAPARTLVAVFASPVGDYLLRFGRELGFRAVLVEPAGSQAPHADVIARELDESFVDDTTDVVVTDHHRPELGAVLERALRLPARWIGLLGNPRHPGPHLPALRELGVPETEIARIHRPIGLNIGSRTPAEIALATLAGLVADRNARPGGFTF